MRSVLCYLSIFLFFSILVFYVPVCSGSSTSAVIADVTIYLPPPHDSTVNSSCTATDNSCGTIHVSNLALDGGWIPNSNCTVTLAAPNGFIGFLLYAVAPDGKHVGSFTVLSGSAQLFDSDTPSGSTLQHMNNNLQKQIIAIWTAPEDAGEPTPITFTALILENINYGYIQKNVIQQTTLVNSQHNVNNGGLEDLVGSVAEPEMHTDAAAAGAAGAAGAAAPVVNCFLTVPANPLTATGLATPYILSTDPTGNTPCAMNTAASQAFVQGAIINTATGAISIYNPLVITMGTTAAVPPIVPTLPAQNVVALWISFNGNKLTLKPAAVAAGAGAGANNNNNAANSLKQGKCVNGVGNSPFGQFAYCNAPQFFNAVVKAFEKGRIATAMNAKAVQKKTGKVPTVIVPAPGVAIDKKPCPTLRDFFVVNQTPSDGTDVTYLITANGQSAQNTAINKKTLTQSATAINPANNALLNTLISPALKCVNTFTAPDLADNGNLVNALPLNEIQAALFQKFPVARVPALDPMVLVNNKVNVFKLDNYRLGVLQFPVFNARQANTKCFCKNMVKIAPARLMANQAVLSNSPSFIAGTSLFQYMVTRFNNAVGPNGLNCGQFGIVSPFTVTTPTTTATGHQLQDEEFESESVEEELNEWHPVPGVEGVLRMTMMGAYDDPTTISADMGMIDDYSDMAMPSILENMDHNNALGLEVDVFSQDNVDALITDPGIDPPTSSDSTPFEQTAAGLAVIIICSVLGVGALVGASVFFYIRKRKQHANAVTNIHMAAATTI